MSILEVPSSLHGPALNSEGKNSNGGYVHQRVAAGGSYEVGLSFLEVQTQFFEVLNIFCIFYVYKLFINCLHGFIYGLCLFTTSP